MGNQTNSQISVPLKALTADSRLQPRVDGIDPDHVRALETVAEHWPPLTVIRQGDRYLLVDGFHRFAAAQDLNLQTVPVVIVEPPEDEDLHELAFSLNSTHGRPLTLSDRRAHAAWLLRKIPNSSDREIGRRCGLTQPTVAKVRQELEQQAQIKPAEHRVGRDGRTYSANPKAGTATIGDLIENLADMFSPAERRAQRQFVRYLKRLADVLEEQNGFEVYESFEAAANACRAVLGDGAAKDLADYLGPESWNILQISRALGYREDAQ